VKDSRDAYRVLYDCCRAVEAAEVRAAMQNTAINSTADRQRRVRGNGEGSISKRQDGRWAAVVSVPKATGGRSRKFYYAATREEAKAKLNKALGDLERGTAPVNERTTVADYLNAWLKSIEPHLRATTYRGYEVNVRRHLIPAIGHRSLAHLSPAHVRRMMVDQTAEGLSPRTVQYIRGTLRTALKEAVADEVVHRNVAELVKGPAVERKEIHPLSPEQVATFLKGVAGDRLEAMYVVAFTLGLRQSELLGLRWGAIDLDAGTLRVEKTLQRGKGVTFGAPKSERSRRTLMIPAVTVEALRSHKARQNEERLLVGPEWQDYGLTFTGRWGRPIGHRSASLYMQRHLVRLKLPHQRFHDARHACATFLLAQGVPLRVVQEILGHSQISLTADTYSHVMASLQRDAMVHIDRAFGTLSPAEADSATTTLTTTGA